MSQGDLSWSSSSHWDQQEDKEVGIPLEVAMRRKQPSRDWEAMGDLSAMVLLCFVALEV